MTIEQVLATATEQLRAHGIAEPRVEAEWLVAHLLDLPRTNVLLERAREFPAGLTARLAECLRRRAAREPLQHILGTVSFCGIELGVSAAALIPRPETEGLAELAWRWLRARTAAAPAPTVLDIGTGTGCLAITLAKECPACRVDAIDVSREALSVASGNVRRHGLTDRITLLEGDVFAALPGDRRYDLIVSNPPYIPAAEIATLAPEVREFDPRLALDGGPDGLDFYRRLAREAGDRLQPDGRLMCEFGDGQAAALRTIFGEPHWRIERVVTDLAGQERMLVAAPARRSIR